MAKKGALAISPWQLEYHDVTHPSRNKPKSVAA
jgi:hypothetical protein